MFHLYAVQARFGDCLILEYGEDQPRYILMDGGPRNNYEESLKPALAAVLKDPSKLDAVIISHVDNDHILGVLDLFVDIKYRQDTGQPVPVQIKELWFNSFSKTIDTNGFENRLKQINSVAGANGIRMQEMNMAVNGIKEGFQVVSLARYLQVAVNPGAAHGLYLGQADKQVFDKSNLHITVVGPTSSNLKKLQDEWEDWISKNEEQIAAGKYTKDFAAMADRSIPNLSSIILLVEAEGKKILLTGDCRGDHLQDGLIETGLSADGRFHCDLLKLPHHGSKRNVTKKFFEEITADTYLVSADGTYDNPDTETLIWIVETAKENGRQVRIVCTNETPSTAALIRDYEPAAWNYVIEFRGKDELFKKVC